MLRQMKLLRSGLLGTMLVAAGSLISGSARASDPLPGDAVAPAVNINIVLLYNEFSDAGTFNTAHGPNDKSDTHLSDDVAVARYIRTFDIDGYLSGVQLFVPRVWFLGQQHVGVNLPSAAPGLLPPIGRGRADLSAQNGFSQPNFGAFIFPINNKATGTYLVVGPWIAPPVSSFNKQAGLNPAENVWTYEAELGYHTTLLGTPKTQNLQLEAWGEGYLYGQNGGSASVSSEVTANDLPASYALAHAFINPAIPGGNPIVRQTFTSARFREQPTAEMRLYLPFQFYPKTAAFVAPGFFQSFGGKQTYKVSGGVIDSGSRTNETQLRLVAGSFVTPNIQLMAAGYYDINAHGGPLNRTVVVRLGLLF